MEPLVPVAERRFGDGAVIEVRQVFEMTDFPPDVQKAADNPTVKAQVEKQKRR